MKRIWLLYLLVAALFAVSEGVLAHNVAYAQSGTVAPADVDPEPQPPTLEAVPLYAPLMGSTPPAACISVDVPATTLSPLRTTPVEVEVLTQSVNQVQLGDQITIANASGVASFTFDAVPNQVYSVQIDGRPAANCDFAFAETPSQWFGIHGDPYAWVGQQSWLDQDGLLYLFTEPTTELVISSDLLTADAPNEGHWTYVLHYAGEAMELYGGILRPGNGTFQHFYRVVLITDDGRVLRLTNLGHVHSPARTGDLTVDSGPGTQSYLWNENGTVDLDGFSIEFKISHTHNGIHQAALVTVPADNSQWIFSREHNGGGAFISARIDGRVITDDPADVGGVFGRLLRDEDPNLDKWVTGVTDEGEMPVRYQAPAEPEADGSDVSVEPTDAGDTDAGDTPVDDTSAGDTDTGDTEPESNDSDVPA
ncbi:MAG: hypothetical protein WDZ49_00865 [Litorilinea sp.]